MTEGDLGHLGARLQQPVTEGVGESFPDTLQLALVAFAITIVNGTLLGAGVRRAVARRWCAESDPRGRRIGPDLPPRDRGNPLSSSPRSIGYRRSGMTTYEDAPEGPTRLLLVDSLLHARGSMCSSTASSTSLHACHCDLADPNGGGRPNPAKRAHHRVQLRLRPAPPVRKDSRSARSLYGMAFATRSAPRSRCWAFRPG